MFVVPRVIPVLDVIPSNFGEAVARMSCIAVLDADVIRPKVSTVIAGIFV